MGSRHRDRCAPAACLARARASAVRPVGGAQHPIDRGPDEVGIHRGLAQRRLRPRTRRATSRRSSSRSCRRSTAPDACATAHLGGGTGRGDAADVRGRCSLVRGGSCPCRSPVAASRRLEPLRLGPAPEGIVDLLAHEKKKTPEKRGGLLLFVREGGVEPPRPFGHWHLKPARLPIPPLARVTAARGTANSTSRGYHAPPALPNPARRRERRAVGSSPIQRVQLACTNRHPPVRGAPWDYLTASRKVSNAQ